MDFRPRKSTIYICAKADCPITGWVVAMIMRDTICDGFESAREAAIV